MTKAESTLSGFDMSFEWTCNLVVNTDGLSPMLFVCKLKGLGSLVESIISQRRVWPQNLLAFTLSCA